ncbi:MAG: hypothetical protein LQ348_005779 [Seirophora lacunosa]|nr:MAG: hypothetical protein LQ348_005779 [Seirophora lacunosa]
MSTPSWLNDVHPLPNGNGSFNLSADPNAFMQMNSATAAFDYNGMQNQQYQQRLQNGSDPRNGSPAFQNPMYQTQPAIPMKRPRPREDSIGASPRQAPGMLPPSRSHTPQQGPYSGFHGAGNGTQPFQTPNPYHRFSNAGSNASLSPSIQNQQFNAQAPPSRVQTVSPAPFSPAAQNFSSQASPPPLQEHNSRVNTPHNGARTYMQGTHYGGTPNQQYNNPTGVSTQLPQNIQQQQQQQQQRMHEIRHRQYLQQMQANPAMQNRYPGMGVNPSMNPSAQMAGMAGMAGMGGRMQHPQQLSMRPNNHEQLVRNIAHWMQQRGLPFNPHPTAAGRPVNLMQLFTLIMRLGGSKAVSARSQWPGVAQHLQVPPAQIMMVAEELHNYWVNNVVHYESWHVQSQQRQRALQEQARQQRPPPNGEMPTSQDSYSPMKQAGAHLQENQPHRPTSQPPIQNGYMTPTKRIDHQQPGFGANQPNGYATPHHASGELRHSTVQSKQGPSLSDQSYKAPSQPAKLPINGTTIAAKPKKHEKDEFGYPRIPHSPLPEKYDPTYEDSCNEPTLQIHGGLVVDFVKHLGHALASARPTMPRLVELGVIDIRALSLSLRSGIKGEVRLALDTLCALSYQMELELVKCEDIVDALVECAEDQVDLLAENTAEVSDAIFINSYEENFRSAKAENEAFQVPPEYGSLEYDLERAVDKLICITTILRNLSSSESSCQQLATSGVITMTANVMRYLGTRNMLLRTHKNTLDFTKDIIVFLSNVSQFIDLPGKEEALCVLHFLLSFAPSPSPTNAAGGQVMFSAYEPSLHCYLPHAIDSFAKLLAKDEPNRGFFRSIFHADASSIPPFELLTKAFGFAISVLPVYELNEQGLEQPKEPLSAQELHERWQEQLKETIQARGPYVVQGLLAAEIIVGLTPASEHSLSRAWLASQDGFAANLIKLVLFFGAMPQPRPHPHPRQPPNARPSETDEVYAMVASRGISMLRKLAERAKDAAETDASGLLSGVLPGKESVFENLEKDHVDSGLLRQICSYAALET